MNKDILDAARKTGLRSFLHGVNAEDSREILQAFLDELNSTPQLNPGEIYVGCLGDQDGNLQHVILLPGDEKFPSWDDAINWSRSINGDLPNRIEQSMLWANHRDQFKKDWYWSNEADRASYDKRAWVLNFFRGNQYADSIIVECRARAVRRVPVEVTA